jgi:hypothetical protein
MTIKDELVDWIAEILVDVPPLQRTIKQLGSRGD